VILDVTTPTMSGLQAAPQIARLDKDCRILIFTMHESDRLAKDVRTAGAHSYVQNSQAGRDRIVAIDALLAGGTFWAVKGQEISRRRFTAGHLLLLGFVLQLEEAETYLLTLTPITRGRPGAHTVAK
jgi:DNA-binding NarL/FixJ family response regulator